jgi:hypothetical protein
MTDNISRYTVEGMLEHGINAQNATPSQEIMPLSAVSIAMNTVTRLIWRVNMMKFRTIRIQPRAVFLVIPLV